MCVRKGDKILTMNGVSLQDITPEGFADMLIEEAPILVSHSWRNPSGGREERERERERGGEREIGRAHV